VDACEEYHEGSDRDCLHVVGWIAEEFEDGVADIFFGAGVDGVGGLVCVGGVWVVGLWVGISVVGVGG